MTASPITTTFILVRKNLIIRRKSPCSTLCQAAILPLFAFFVIIYSWFAMYKVQNKDILADLRFADLHDLSSISGGPFTYAIPPNAPPATSYIAGNLTAIFNDNNIPTMQFHSDAAMNDYCRLNQCFAGVVLNGPTPDGAGYNYTLRVDDMSSQVARFSTPQNPAGPNAQTGNVQWAVEQSILRTIAPAVANEFTNAKVRIQQGVSAQVTSMFFRFIAFYGTLLLASFY